MTVKYRLKKDCVFSNAVIKRNSIFTALLPDDVAAYLKTKSFSFAFRLRLEKDYMLGTFSDGMLRWIPKNIANKITK